MTAQTPELLYLDGQCYRIDHWPALPDEGWGLVRREASQWQEMDIALLSSCCWREYLGTWTIDNQRLYLSEVRGQYRLTNGPLFACWFSGELILPQGELVVCCPELDFKLEYERALVIEIEQGRVVASRSVSHR
ncbi:hypothetical protein FCL40_14885 [Ferrimonas sediminicola]|uniref:Uncharacterized protein n=1 Tax=Ferrimonas sediminicola TaxID=2569538 RepID=A0A4U1BAP3_9GAMM|nr:hypothetical protein [Ferrimonas sediminicola]TKB47760.1 hypothetical protein FCL40_14885 [Ferrimonas sediminicola]